MKFFLMLFMICIIVLPLVSVALADSAIYEIPELSMQIQPPEGWVTFTRDFKTDDPDLSVLGLERASLMKQYKQYGIYLNAIQRDPLAEIVVVMVETKSSRQIFNFLDLTEEQLDEIAINMMSINSEHLIDEMEKKKDVDLSNIEEVKYSGYTKNSSAQADYLVLSFSQMLHDTPIYSKQYYTIMNGQAISITLKSYARQITDEYDDILLSMVDSVQFTEIKEKPKGIFALFGVKGTGNTGVILAIVGFILIYVFTKIRKYQQYKNRKNSQNP